MFKWGGYTDNKDICGLDNFKILFKSDKFYQAFQNSILLIVLVTLVTFMKLHLRLFAYICQEKLKEKHVSVIFTFQHLSVLSVLFSRGNLIEPRILNFWICSRNGRSKIVIYNIVIALYGRQSVYIVMYMASMANVPESLSRRLWKARERSAVLYDHNSADLDKHQNNTTFFVISTINMSFLLVKQWQTATGRSVKCILKLYVSEAYTNSSMDMSIWRSVWASSRLHLQEFWSWQQTSEIEFKGRRSRWKQSKKSKPLALKYCTIFVIRCPPDLPQYQLPTAPIRPKYLLHLLSRIRVLRKSVGTSEKIISELYRCVGEGEHGNFTCSTQWS